jgi:HEPN domain-containing protein
MERSGDWLAQAQRDLQAARVCAGASLHDVACFHAQQAAEKGLKAVYNHRGEVAWGHSVEGLLRNLGPELSVEQELIRRAERLDRHYIASRYPNGWQHGAPMQHYRSEDSDEAIGDSEAILAWCDGLLAGS